MSESQEIRHSEVVVTMQWGIHLRMVFKFIIRTHKALFKLTNRTQFTIKKKVNSPPTPHKLKINLALYDA